MKGEEEKRQTGRNDSEGKGKDIHARSQETNAISFRVSIRGCALSSVRWSIRLSRSYTQVDGSIQYNSLYL